MYFIERKVVMKKIIYLLIGLLIIPISVKTQIGNPAFDDENFMNDEGIRRKRKL